MVSCVGAKEKTTLNFDVNGTFEESIIDTMDDVYPDVIIDKKIKTKDEIVEPLNLLSYDEVVASIDSKIIKDYPKYKAKYIDDNYDLVGDYTVLSNGHTVTITVFDSAYVEDTGVLQLNITASVDGVSKRIRNPYKISNPPTMVVTKVTEELVDKISHKTGLKKGERLQAVRELKSSPSDAVIQSISYVVVGIENGEPTFGDGDPTLTVYAHPDTGGLNNMGISGGSTFLDAITATTSNYNEGNADLMFAFAEYTYDCCLWIVQRLGTSYDTSAINEGATIDSATTGYHGVCKYDNTPTMGVGITGFFPLDPTEYINTDFGRNGTVRYADDISYASFNVAGWNTYTFNAAGKAAINTSGYTSTLLRLGADISSIDLPNTEAYPLWDFCVYSPHRAGTAQDPYLTVVYTPVPPVASFDANITIGYAPLAVEFTDTSYATPTSWSWKRRNETHQTGAEFSTLENPSAIFGNGTYRVNLTSTNAYGSDTSADTWINVSIPSTTCDWSADTPIILSGNTITFTPVSDAPAGSWYNWSFGDGSWTNQTSDAAVTHDYAGTNIYSPTLYIAATTGATNSTTRTDYIGVNSAKFYPSTDGYVSRTTAAGWSTIRTGVGTAVDSSATSAYTRVSSAVGASDFSRLDRIITIFDTGELSETFYLTNASLNVYGNAKGSTFGTNPNLVVTNVSTLASLNSIIASDYNKYGTASLSDSNISYAGYQTAAYNQIWLNDGGVDEINIAGKTPYMLRTSWDADNAAPAWLASKASYFQPFMSEQAGTTQDPFLLVNFSAVPVYFSANTTIGLIGAGVIQFTDDTETPDVTWNWSFGDGEYSDVQNPVHTYAAQGLFDVTFTSPIGGSYLTKTDYINISAPSFVGDVTYGEIPLSVTFTDTSAVLTDDVWWNYGDTHSEFDGGVVTHIYTVAGDYDVQIQTPSAAGDIITYTSYIHAGTIIPSTAFTANVTEIVSGDYVLFTDESTNDPIQWKWDFNGTTASDSTSQNPEARFPTPGLYSINLTASNLAGNSSLVKTNYITVSNPTTSFIYNTSEIAAGGYVTFNGSTTGSTAATWTWDFDGGTGSDSTSSDPVWGFTTPGNYTVNATSYVAGGSDSEIMVEIIRVYPAGWVPGMTGIVSVDFAASPHTYVNVGTALDFIGVVVGDTPSYKWDFYGGTDVDDTVLEPSFTYPAAGVFDVNFTAYNPISGLSEVKEDYITVVAIGAPYAQFTAQPTSGTPGLLVNFVDKSLKGTALNLTYNWSFGDGVYSITPYSSTIGDVAHVYAYAGVYDASLTIVNDNGTSNQTRLQYIVVSTDQTVQTTFYTPKQIGITAMYRNPAGVRIINATIALTAIASTLPNTAGLDQEQSLQYIFGINPMATNAMLNGTLIMSGNTGGDGSVAFSVVSSIGYLVEVTDPQTGVVWESTLYPSDPAGLYTIWVGESPFDAQANASINTMNATRMYLSEPDIGNVTMNLIFQDISGGTTNVLFEVYSANNMSLLSRTDLGNPGTGILTANYTVPNVRGNGYYYGYNATRS